MQSDQARFRPREVLRTGVAKVRLGVRLLIAQRFHARLIRLFESGCATSLLAAVRAIRVQIALHCGAQVQDWLRMTAADVHADVVNGLHDPWHSMCGVHAASNARKPEINKARPSAVPVVVRNQTRQSSKPRSVRQIQK